MKSYKELLLISCKIADIGQVLTNEGVHNGKFEWECSALVAPNNSAVNSFLMGTSLTCQQSQKVASAWHSLVAKLMTIQNFLVKPSRYILCTMIMMVDIC